MGGECYDTVVIGGGLAGVVAAFKLSTLGMNVALVDDSLPAAEGQLGGFAKFSGAKFSLLPAGQGLIPVVGSEDSLRHVTSEVLSFLGLDTKPTWLSDELHDDHALVRNLTVRSYHSILLTSEEIDALLARLLEALSPRVHVFAARASKICSKNELWTIGLDGADAMHSRHLIFAGGRTGGSILSAAGARPQNGKGLDVGARLEFVDRAALANLRALGPDAKILGGACRTFCLNSPGKVYRYEHEGISIPGGIVADKNHKAGNVGLLYRIAEKTAERNKLFKKLAAYGHQDLPTRSTVFSMRASDTHTLLRDLFGTEIATSLTEFANRLGEAGLIAWDSPHLIHLPLLDWHWNTYAVGATHRTSEPRLWVAGDCAGHARGLLQAALSGWLAAQEIFEEENG